MYQAILLRPHLLHRPWKAIPLPFSVSILSLFGLCLCFVFFYFHLPISELWGQILLNKQQAAKKQVWILDPICLLWATQLTLSPRQSPTAVWKIFLCKDSFQMGEIKPLFNSLHSRVFQEYFSRLRALKLPHRLSWHISEHVAHSLIIILWKHHSDCNTVLILLLTFQQKHAKYILGHQDTTAYQGCLPCYSLWSKNTMAL